MKGSEQPLTLPLTAIDIVGAVQTCTVWLFFGCWCGGEVIVRLPIYGSKETAPRLYHRFTSDDALSTGLDIQPLHLDYAFTHGLSGFAWFASAEHARANQTAAE